MIGSKMRKYKFLLFDLDGTVSESAPGIVKGVKHSLEAVGITENDPEVLKTFIGPPLNVQYKKLYNMSDEDIVKAVTAFREVYETEGILDCAPYEGLDKLFQKAKEEGCILCVASSKPEPFVIQIMENFGFAPHFTVISGSRIGDELDKRAVASQKTRIILKTLSLLEEKGFTKEEMEGKTVMIGDTFYDIDGAKDTHLPSVGVTYGYGSEKELKNSGADFIVHSVSELEELLFPSH